MRAIQLTLVCAVYWVSLAGVECGTGQTLAWPSASPSGDKGPSGQALTPAEARKRVGETVTVEMLVKAVKNSLAKRGEIYLDSEDDFRDEKNLAVVITKAAAEKFKNAGVADPAVHFKGKRIQVTGAVTLKDSRARMEVTDPKQIRELER